MKKLSKAKAEELKSAIKSNKTDDDVVEFFSDYYTGSGDMPYEVARAHTADPIKWTAKKIKGMTPDALCKIVDTLTETKMPSLSEMFTKLKYKNEII